MVGSLEPRARTTRARRPARGAHRPSRSRFAPPTRAPASSRPRPWAVCPPVPRPRRPRRRPLPRLDPPHSPRSARPIHATQCVGPCASCSGSTTTTRSRSTSASRWRRHPDVLAAVTGVKAHDLYPPLGEIRDAFFNARGARVDGRALVAAIEHAAPRARGGVALRLGRTVVVEGGRVVAVEHADGVVACGTVVLAGGAWTPALAEAFGLRCGIRPVADRSCTSTSTPTRRRGRCSSRSSATTWCPGTTAGSRSVPPSRTRLRRPRHRRRSPSAVLGGAARQPGPRRRDVPRGARGAATGERRRPAHPRCRSPTRRTCTSPPVTARTASCSAR